MLFGLFSAALYSLHEFAVIGYLVYETKLALLLCDSPGGYVTRITSFNAIDLPEDEGDISNQLLFMLSVVYQARLIMEKSNDLVKKEKMIPHAFSPSFNVEIAKRKRRSSSSEKSNEA